MKGSPTTIDSVTGGSAAASAEARIKYDMGSKVNAPDSIAGGSAATNFQTNPMYGVTPGGGMNQSGINVGGSYKIPVKIAAGTETNDHAK